MLGLVLLAACAQPGDSPATDSSQNSSASAVPGRDLAALSEAASWRGEIPCADCSGILTTITLYPDGGFRAEGAYLGTNGGGDTVAAALGRWTFDQARETVRLQGSMEAPQLYAVDPDGALRLLDSRGNDISSNLNYRLAPISVPAALTHPARVTGAFRYLADAATFVECRSGLQYPVHMRADFPSLQQAYANAGGRGQPLGARLSAHLDTAPAMEGDGTELGIVVDSVHRVSADDGCAALQVLDSVADTEWRLIALTSADSADGEPLPVSDRSDAGFLWDTENSRLSGSGGCNSFTARAVFRGTTRVGGAAAATKRFCNPPELMDIEQRFFELLGADVAVRLQSETLIWSRGPRDVARFVERPR